MVVAENDQRIRRDPEGDPENWPDHGVGEGDQERDERSREEPRSQGEAIVRIDGPTRAPASGGDGETL